MKSRWVWFLVSALITAAAGLVLGQFRSKDYLSQLYQRSDFILLDDKGDFFQLSKFPEKKKLLLVFAPDDPSPSDVKPFYDFWKKAAKWPGADVMLLSRGNKDTILNFRDGAAFSGRVLFDASGSTGRILGAWPDAAPVKYWSYFLLDRDFQVFWSVKSERVLSYAEVSSAAEKAMLSPPTSSAAP